jgi:hypothetical protein
MPFPRQIVTEEGYSWEKFIERVKFHVSVVPTALPQLAWIHLISQFFRTDKELASNILDELIDDEHLLFIGRADDHNIYINVRATVD